MEHHPVRAPRGVQENPDHVVMGIPIVDLDGLAEAVRQVQVPAERLLLVLHPLGARPVVVQAGLPHGPHPRVGRKRLDLRQRGVQVAAGGQPGGVVGVDGHGPQQPGLSLDGLDGEARRLHVTAHLDGPGNPDGCRSVHRLVHVHGDQAIAEVQVGVVVHHRHPQRLGGRRVLQPALALGFLLVRLPPPLARPTGNGLRHRSVGNGDGVEVWWVNGHASHARGAARPGPAPEGDYHVGVPRPPAPLPYPLPQPDRSKGSRRE